MPARQIVLTRASLRRLDSHWTLTVSIWEVTYWLNKWMDDDSYEKYKNAPGNQTPSSETDYLLDYTINGNSYKRW